jgi:hypothetical protein
MLSPLVQTKVRLQIWQVVVVGGVVAVILQFEFVRLVFLIASIVLGMKLLLYRVFLIILAVNRNVNLWS